MRGAVLIPMHYPTQGNKSYCRHNHSKYFQMKEVPVIPHKDLSGYYDLCWLLYFFRETEAQSSQSFAQGYPAESDGLLEPV